MRKVAIATAFVLGFMLAFAYGARLKDITTVEGARENMLIGYGLVVGLDGTGDGTKTFYQSIANMLERMGIRIPVAGIKVRNVAAVIVTAKLPPFAAAGMRIDVDVASIGDAKSLYGGTLLMTPLFGPDGKVYAVAQGPISIGGANMRGGGQRTQKNHPTAARIPNGAIVERSLPNVPVFNGVIKLNLNVPDFVTASRIVRRINAIWPSAARALSPATVEVRVPDDFRGREIEFIAMLQNIEVTADRIAKIIVSERTGTVVLGGDLRILPVAVSHGNLTVKIQKKPEVIQQGAGQVPNQTRSAKEEKGSVLALGSGKKEVSVSDLINALNKIGASPRDIIAILKAIKAAGALEGELEIM